MMGKVAAELGKKLVVFVVGSLLVSGVCSAVQNKIDGKDILGRKKVNEKKKKTYVDWRGNVHLCENEYKVV